MRRFFYGELGWNFFIAAKGWIWIWSRIRVWELIYFDDEVFKVVLKLGEFELGDVIIDELESFCILD